MADNQFLICDCPHCAGSIEYPAEGGGMVVSCPHCEASMSLPVPFAPETPEEESSVAPAGKSRSWTGWIIGLVAVVAVAGVFIVWPQFKPPPRPVTARPPPARTNAPPPALTVLTNLPEGLTVSEVLMEKAPAGALVYVVGAVKNESSRQRFGVKVELDLFDNKNTKIGMATDYQPVIEPQAEWRFRALVLDAKAASARLAALKEEQ